MLLLLALGVDRETIIEDYFATNMFSRKEIMKTLIFAPFVIKSRWQRKCLKILMTVKREYMERLLDKIENNYDDVFDFFEKQYSISKDDIIALRNKYLD